MGIYYNFLGKKIHVAWINVFVCVCCLLCLTKNKVWEIYAITSYDEVQQVQLFITQNFSMQLLISFVFAGN